MPYRIVREGYVTKREPNSPTACVLGPRAAVTAGGEIICSYNVQSARGLNDLKPMLARSDDAGVTWREQGFVWPHLRDVCSIVGSVSAAPNKDLFIFGSRTPIDRPGERCWSETTGGLKPNELIWAASADHGATWTEPATIPMPIPGSAEAPGAMCITRSGRWVCCYSPYNTFDPNLRVEHNQVVSLSSNDKGKTWSHAMMLRFPDRHSQSAEAWIVELSDGRLLGAAWHANKTLANGHPNAYSLSEDGGLTWSTTRSTGILGQALAMTPLADGRALFVYNQRQYGEIGVWLATVRPTDDDFGIESNAIIWRAKIASPESAPYELNDWIDFCFGEPSITILPNGELLVTLWCIENGMAAVRYLKLQMSQTGEHRSRHLHARGARQRLTHA